MQPTATDIILGVTAFIAFVAVYQASRIFKEQQELTKQIHKEQKASALRQQELTERIHLEQLKFEQRQLFIPLFAQLKGISRIDPELSKDYEIVNSINFLDLLGISYEGQLVDKQILLRVFRDFIIEQYEQLELCVNRLQNHTKSGRDMLYESRSASSLYRHLKDEDLKRDKPTDFIKE